MNTHLRTIPVALAALLIAAPTVHADKYETNLITPVPRGELEVYVWPDRGMDGVYYPGDRINVNVEVTRDAFLILYNIDTRGRMHILYPSSPWDDNFVEAGEVISFPRWSDDVDWEVDGPPGTEYVQVVASEIPISPPEWPVYSSGVNVSANVRISDDLNAFISYDDRHNYIDVVNRNISGRYYDWCATDVATFYVRPRPVYRHVSHVDPWPDRFYGQIYIGWPIGSRIYIDDIYIGTAPCYVPRHYYGRRVITCYDGPRLIRRHVVNCYPKHDYYAHHNYHNKHGVYKKARPDVYDYWQVEKSARGKRGYNIIERSKVGVYNGSDSYRADVKSQGKTKWVDGKNEFVIDKEAAKSNGVNISKKRKGSVSTADVTQSEKQAAAKSAKSDEFIMKSNGEKTGKPNASKQRAATVATADVTHQEKKATTSSAKRRSDTEPKSDRALEPGRPAKAQVTQVKQSKRATVSNSGLEVESGTSGQKDPTKWSKIQAQDQSASTATAQSQDAQKPTKSKSTQTKNSQGKDRSGKRSKGSQ